MMVRVLNILCGFQAYLEIMAATLLLVFASFLLLIAGVIFFSELTTRLNHVFTFILEVYFLISSDQKEEDD